MTKTLLDAPKFCTAQVVWFIGGEGVVLSSQPKAGAWIYLIEMALGPEPTFGRKGYETMVVLNEVDLYEPGQQMWVN
ncbi:hypothetical protein JOY44_05700 [Phormidium sp. CLA17]|uniref:hypothetical protein n=1 Tax=Leptolyngbya sp. Cla-17 TaxID=2803751 RepID=UPI001492A2BE|nr:hypothetical protein [Leptolyngbya sp. Cla-17]MBM0741116.1 hypothetical protein [Leptolyngbya sp. Cla-17]